MNKVTNSLESKGIERGLLRFSVRSGMGYSRLKMMRNYDLEIIYKEQIRVKIENNVV